MELLFIFLSTITVITSSVTLCRVGCRCSNDDSCEYYCKNNQCQDSLDHLSECVGHNVHPRECGSSFCDPFSDYTCQFRKTTGEMCMYDWACYSKYCDSKLQTCQYSPDSWSPTSVPILVTVLVGGVGGTLVIVIIVSIIVRIQKRQRNANPNVFIYCSNH